MNAKKILCLVIPSLQGGGMERVMSELSFYFCRREEIEVHLILYGKIPEIFYEIPENIRLYKPSSVFNERLRFISTFGRMLFLRRKVKLVNPDSILSFGEYWNSFVLLALIGLNHPVYISDRCSPEKKFVFFHQLLRKWLYPKAKGIIAQTEKAKQIYCSQFNLKNVCVIGNPIRQIQNYNTLKKENFVLSVGRLIETKHHDKLIELFARISNNDWKLVIVGDDSIKQKNMTRLKELVRDLNMGERVLLAGKQSDVDSFYLRSKIFAFTSSSEGFPNVIGEAMSAGLAVISFDCVAGPAEMIADEKNGFLVDVFDFKSFEVKLRILMHREDLRVLFGEAARERIREFNVNIIGSRFLEFITNSPE